MEEKLIIRAQIALTPFQAGDQPNLLRYMNDPVLYRNTLLIPSPYTETHADEWLQHTRDHFQQHGRTFHWAIRHEKHGLIGGMGAFLRTGLEGHLDEIGYWLAEPFRGQGIMTDAVRVFCQWLFDTRPTLARIEAKTRTYNPESVRVLEKAGFEREGYLRKAALKDGELADLILLARIRE